MTSHFLHTVTCAFLPLPANVSPRAASYLQALRIRLSGRNIPEHTLACGPTEMAQKQSRDINC